VPSATAHRSLARLAARAAGWLASGSLAGALGVLMLAHP
jgi:hypothetical protein